jgi:drug/metabolite transporter (DMT)-like permease
MNTSPAFLVKNVARHLCRDYKLNWHTLALPLVIISVLLYHVTQKNIPQSANPLIVVALAYFFAICICLAGFFLSGENKKLTEIFRGQSLLASALLGIAAIGIELGFLFAYRNGWKVSMTATTIGTFTTIALAIIGVLWFKETLTAVNVIGIVLCIIGVVCINMR